MTLVIAKLDRLARNARFLLSIVEGTGSNGVVFCDLPTVPVGPVGKLLVTQMAAVAELEAGLISQRTKAALAMAKARGVALGGWKGGPKVDGQLGRAAQRDRADAFAMGVEPIASALRDGGKSLRQIAAALTTRGIRTPRGEPGRQQRCGVSFCGDRAPMLVSGRSKGPAAAELEAGSRASPNIRAVWSEVARGASPEPASTPGLQGTTTAKSASPGHAPARLRDFAFDSTNVGSAYLPGLSDYTTGIHHPTISHAFFDYGRVTKVTSLF